MLCEVDPLTSVSCYIGPTEVKPTLFAYLTVTKKKKIYFRQFHFKFFFAM